jgi:hypothetical protein
MGNKGDMVGSHMRCILYLSMTFWWQVYIVHVQTYSTTATTLLGPILTVLLFTGR